MTGFIKKYKAVIIAALLITAVLIIAFISGGRIGDEKTSPDTAVKQQNQTIATVSTDITSVSTSNAASTAAQTTVASTQSVTEHSTTVQSVTEKIKEHTQSQTQAATDKYKTDPIPHGKPKPVEPQQQTTEDSRIYCTFSISCSNILGNKDELDPSIADIIPPDGWIIKPERVEVNDGESVFDILIRVCKDNNIHMEYSWTPIYNSAYIEGIGNIYEFDCGELSGWMYKVNDWYPNYGCSRYVVKNGDVIQWNYTLNSGRDLEKDYNN